MQKHFCIKNIFPFLLLSGALVISALLWGINIALKLFAGVFTFLLIYKLYDLTKALISLVILFSILQIVFLRPNLYGGYNAFISTADVIAGLMLLFMIIYRTVHAKSMLQKDPYGLPLMLVLIGSLLSLFAARNLSASIYMLMIITCGYVFYRFINSFFDTEKDFEFLILLVMVSLLLIFMVGFYTVYIRKAQMSGPGILLERLGYVFAGPNGLGGILTFLLPLCIIPLFSKNVKLRVAAIFLIIGSLALLLPTYSRNSYLSLIISILVILFMLFGKKAIIIASLVGLILLIAAPLLPSVLHRVATVGYFKYDMSALARIILWRIALTDFLHNPLTGVGLANYWYTALNIPLSPYCHNLYLSLFAEIGVLGGFGFILLIISIFRSLRRALKLCRISSFQRITVIALIGSWTAIISHGFFDQIWFFADRTHEMKFFWLILSLTAIALKQTNLLPINTPSKDSFDDQ